MEWIKTNKNSKGIVNEINKLKEKQEKLLLKYLGIPNKHMGAGQHIIVGEEMRDKIFEALPEELKDHIK